MGKVTGSRSERNAREILQQRRIRRLLNTISPLPQTPSAPATTRDTTQQLLLLERRAYSVPVNPTSAAISTLSALGRLSAFKPHTSETGSILLVIGRMTWPSGRWMSTSSISLARLGDVRFEFCLAGRSLFPLAPHRMRKDGGGHDGEELGGAGEMHGSPVVLAGEGVRTLGDDAASRRGRLYV
ncbi:hypothetical protein LTR12_008220 [Friedmanniomyces endolithicus]|nr:hypothetical protein LTR12_008220 [Friedmanniomyces endolithicus]